MPLSVTADEWLPAGVRTASNGAVSGDRCATRANPTSVASARGTVPGWACTASTSATALAVATSLTGTATVRPPAPRRPDVMDPHHAEPWQVDPPGRGHLLA